MTFLHYFTFYVFLVHLLSVRDFLDNICSLGSFPTEKIRDSAIGSIHTVSSHIYCLLSSHALH
jgi:hypothetical protein